MSKLYGRGKTSFPAGGQPITSRLAAVEEPLNETSSLMKRPTRRALFSIIAAVELVFVFTREEKKKDQEAANIFSEPNSEFRNGRLIGPRRRLKKRYLLVS